MEGNRGWAESDAGLGSAMNGCPVPRDGATEVVYRRRPGRRVFVLKESTENVRVCE